MKRCLKKILLILIIFIIVFEFTFSNTVNAASVINEETLNAITNLAGGIVSIVLWIPRILIIGFAFVMNLIIHGVAISEGKIPDSSSFSDGVYVTPFHIFFNQYAILDINFFDISGLDTDSFLYKFRTAVAFWFYVLRLISSVILLCILIYVGIRMAISSVAEDKAKYKKMLFDWACSLALIFILQYLAIGLIYLNDAIVGALGAMTSSEDIDSMMNGLAKSATLGVGITSLVSTGVYCMIVIQTLFFFVAYVNRMLKVGFLIIISPLISLTYSIDKMGDGRAQALNNWLKEFVYTILIQPFHCIIYIALIKTAFELVTGAASVTITSLPNLLQTAEFNKLANGVLAILCLKFVSDGEKVVRRIFGFNDDNRNTSMAAGAIATMAVLNNANKIGASARKGFNAMRTSGSSLIKAAGDDFNKLKSTKAGQAVGNKVSNAKNRISDFGKKVGNTQAGKKVLDAGQKAKTAGADKLRETKDKAKTLQGRYKGSKAQKFAKKLGGQVRKSIPLALGGMAMAMSYAAGDTGLLEANAIRKGITDGSREFFNSSTKTLAGFEEDNMEELEKQDYEEVNEKLKDAQDEVDKLGFGSNVTQEEAEKIANSDEAKNAAEKAKKADEEAKKQKQELEKAKEAVQKEQEKLEKAKEEKANAKSKSERRKAQSKIDSINDELKKKEEREAELAKATERKQLESDRLKEEANRYSKLKQAVFKRDTLAKEKADFFTEDAVKARIASRASGPSKSELEKKKNQILKLIMKLKLQNSNGQEAESMQNNHITEDDSDSAMQTMENILKSVDASLLKGGASIKASDMIMDRAGLNSRSSETLDSIDKAVKEYENLKREESIAETFSKHASYEGESDRLIDAMYNNLARNSNVYKSSGADKE